MSAGSALRRFWRRLSGSNDKVMQKLYELVRDHPRTTLAEHELWGMVQEAHRQVWGGQGE